MKNFSERTLKYCEDHFFLQIWTKYKVAFIKLKEVLSLRVVSYLKHNFLSLKKNL